MARSDSNPLYKPITRKIADEILSAAIAFTEPTYLPSPYRLYGFSPRMGKKYYFRKYDFHREIKRLEKKKFIALTKTEKGWLIKLLEKGKRRLKALKVKDVQLTVPKVWDHRWRLYIFDIPEKYRGARDVLRTKLKNMGLYNIQRSVFAYPYDFRKELEFVTDFYGLTKYGTYAEVNYIDINKELKKHFSL